MIYCIIIHKYAIKKRFLQAQGQKKLNLRRQEVSITLVPSLETRVKYKIRNCNVKS